MQSQVCRIWALLHARGVPRQRTLWNEPQPPQRRNATLAGSSSTSVVLLSDESSISYRPDINCIPDTPRLSPTSCGSGAREEGCCLDSGALGGRDTLGGCAAQAYSTERAGSLWKGTQRFAMRSRVN